MLRCFVLLECPMDFKKFEQTTEVLMNTRHVFIIYFEFLNDYYCNWLAI